MSLYVFVAITNCCGAYPVGCSYIIQLGLQVISKQQSCYWNMRSTQASIIFIEMRFDRLPAAVGQVDMCVP